MRFNKTFQAIDTHTGGQPTRILTGLFPTIPGETMDEKRRYMVEHKDDIRQLLCEEPRGHKSMYCALLTEPVNPEAKVGVIFMSSVTYDNMCGHGTIGLVTALLETGLINLDNDEGGSELVIDTPSGPLTTYPQLQDGEVKSVSFQGVPSFVYEKDIELEVDEYGVVKGDLAFGGNWYFYVNAKDLNTKVQPEKVSSLLKKGNKIKEAVVNKYQFNHPTRDSIRNELTGVSIYQHPQETITEQKNIVVESKFFYDRSPCGTGTCGRMAILSSSGQLNKGDAFLNKSITGSVFRGEVIGKTKVGTHEAIKPKITGQAYITGFNQFVVDPKDPLKEGFLYY